MIAKWSLDGSVCPICGGSGRESSRHPAALCEKCQKDICDSQGNPVEMFNEGFSGGLEIRTATGTVKSPDAEDMALFAGTIECRAREHRFGGVVVQPVHAWDEAD